MTANLSLADRPFSEFSTSYRPSDLNLNRAFQQQEPEPPLQTPPLSEPLQPLTLPPISSLQNTIDDHQPSLIPVLPEDPERIGGRPLHPGFSNASPDTSEDNITKGNAKAALIADLQEELPSTPQPDVALLADKDAKPLRSVADFNHDNTPSASTACQDPHLLDLRPPKPPRPSTSLSTAVGADIAMLKEQRNETYQIKHFNWFDHNSRTLRRSSMLTQNKNGPCPLLALVNALILDGENDSCSALGAALRTREQVSLGLIIESLMDELTSEGRGGQLTELPDVDELNRFLLMLHTGMTANPRLAPPATWSPNLMDARNSSLHLPLSLNNDRTPGTFEDTQTIRLYGAFAIPLVHGWLAPRSDPARAAFTRSAQTYEDAQTIQFGEEELEDKLSREGLTREEQQLLQDISSIKSFLDCYPTQITPFGLDIINESLFPGSKAILFRNDHFSTIYKDPESGQLFTLVTDAGYSDKDEVIWESLVDVSGQNSEFFSGDFRPVGNVGATNQQPQSELGGSSTPGIEQHSSQLHGLESATSTQQQQQQADADFAMALQLQEEEDARMEDSRRGSGVNDAIPNRSSDPSNSRRLRDRDASRPAIPPRNSRNQGVNRPVDPNSDEAPPPAYEEAAKGKPYLPPTGHPHHPSFDGRSPTSVPSTPMHPPGPRAGQAYPRRTSAFQENSQFQSNSPLTRPHTNNSIGVAQSSARPRDRDKDCIVM
jgi:ubiquitin carboxyl-terminal hydrolase MINDY-1/2